MGPDEEDLSIDYELAEQQRARLAADGKDALDKGVKACEDWAAQQTTARWGVEPGAQRFRRAYQNFILTLADELRKNAAELDEFTTRLQQALKDFAHNEEQLQQAITQITTDLESSFSNLAPNVRGGISVPGSGQLPPNMRME